MRRLGYIVAALLALSGAARAATGDTTWTRPTHAANFPLDGLPAPGVASDPHTAAITLGFVTPGTCGLASTGVDGTVVCAANPVASISFTDPLENTGTSTAPIIGLKFTNVDLILGGGGVLEVAGFTGAIVKAAGAISTTFGVVGPMTALANGTGSSVAPTFIGPAANGQVFQALTSSSLGWGFVPTTSITGLAAIATSGSATDLVAGTIPTARLPTFTADVVNAGLAMTIQPNVVSFAKTQQIPALSVVANPTGSLANETTVTTTSGSQFVLGENGAGALAFGPVTPASTAGLIANWPLANVRWYCVSTSTGSDANVGYSDVSSADCGTKAKATFAGLSAIYPRQQAGRKSVIEIASGTYAGGLDVFLQGVTGAATNFPLVVATGTNSTAGAVAFAGDANDRTFAGGVTAAGMNAAGYNPIGTLSASLVKAQKVGGGSPGFGAEPALPLFARMRFGSATATSALQNVSRMVMIVTGSDTLTPLSAFPATPTTSDVFYLEMPGVITDTTNLSLPPAATQTAFQIVGISAPSGLSQFADGGLGIFSFCQFANINFRIGDSVRRPTYVDETGATRTMGLGIRVDGIMLGIDRFNASFIREAFGVTGQTTLEGITMFSWGNGTSVWGGLSLISMVGAVGDDNDQPVSIIGGRFHAGEPTARIRGLVTLHSRSAGLYVAQSSFTISNLDISSMGANPAIILRGKCSFFAEQNLVGSSGNTDVGLDLLNSVGSTIVIGTTLPTLTGTVGDIRLSDGTIITWTQAAAGVIDARGNRFVGEGTTYPIAVTPAGGTVLSGGTLTVTNLAGAGGFAKLTTAGKFVLDPSSYVAAPASNGLLAWNGTITLGRTLINSDGTINFTNADGVAGNPEIHVNVIPESKVTNLVTDLTNINTAIAGKQPTGNYITGISSGPVGFSGFSGGLVASTVNLSASGFLGVLPIVDLAPGSPGQVITMVGSTPTWVTPTAGTVYTGISPIIVNAGTGQISCPTCGTSSGSVTGVFGTAGQVNVTPSTPNPVVSLPNVGPGATTTGGTGIASVTTDLQGRLVSAATASYLTGTGTTPGTYNYFTVASSGLITGASVSSWIAAGSLMMSGGLTALPVAATAGIDYQAPVVNPTAGQVMVSAGTAVDPQGDTHFTYDRVAHVLTSSGGSVLGGSVVFSGAAGAGEVLMEVGNTGAYGLAFTGTGLHLSGGVLSGLPFVASGGSHAIGMVPDPGGTAGTTRILYEDATWKYATEPMWFEVRNNANTWTGLSEIIPEGGIVDLATNPPGGEYASGLHGNVTLLLNVFSNVCSGGGSWAVTVTKNGSPTSATLTVTCGFNGVVTTGSVSLGSPSSTDTYGLLWNTTGAFGSVGEYRVLATALLQ